MKNFFYLAALRRSIIQFLDLFNDIKIAKYDEDGNILKHVLVPIKYAPKQKFYTWAYDRKYEKRFPMMGVEMLDIARAEDRVSGKFTKIPITTTSSDITFYQNGVPYDVSLELHVTTNYLSEMDQITEQILSYFNPHAVSVVGLADTDLTWDMKILLESAGIDQDVNIEMDMVRKIHWTFTFKLETYLFKALDSVKTILKVTNKYYLNDDSFDSRDTTTDMISGGGGEEFEGLTIGWKEDAKIMTRYEKFE